METHQQGVTLLITFLTVTVMLAVVLNISIIMFNELNILGNVGTSVTSSYAADSGIERVVWADRKQTSGNPRGFCNICDSAFNNHIYNCPPSECANCVYTELPNPGSGGCNPAVCNNCSLTYQSSFDGRTYLIDARVFPYGASTVFDIHSKGIYQTVTRVFEASYTP